MPDVASAALILAICLWLIATAGMAVWIAFRFPQRIRICIAALAATQLIVAGPVGMALNEECLMRWGFAIFPAFSATVRTYITNIYVGCMAVNFVLFFGLIRTILVECAAERAERLRE